MPFQASVEYLGTPDFGLIRIDPQETAAAFQAYISTASRLTGVSLSDINKTIIAEPKNRENPTLVDLLEVGMKLFDAIVWLTADRPADAKLRVDPAMKKETIPSLHDVARSVFFCYFMLIVQARYPAGSNISESNRPVIPNFLKTIMGLDKDQHVYIDTICSFEPQKFDPKWAKFVSFSGFGQEVMSRFGLGVAGYRMFGPFALYAPKPNLPANLQRAYNFARAVAVKPATWNVHPLTRDPNILKKRGNLNKNLGNLILEVFTTDEIAEMHKSKMIYRIPEKEPTHRNYMTWSEEDDISGDATILPMS